MSPAGLVRDPPRVAQYGRHATLPGLSREPVRPSHTPTTVSHPGHIFGHPGRGFTLGPFVTNDAVLDAYWIPVT